MTHQPGNPTDQPNVPKYPFNSMHNTSTTLPDAHSLLFGFDQAPTKPTRRKKATMTADHRHHEITASWSERYRRALGIEYVFCGRDASALKRFLAVNAEDADAILATAEKAWAVVRTDRFARACRMAATIHGLCGAYNEIRVELKAVEVHSRSNAVMP